MSELTVAAIKKLKVTELKAELSKRGLAVKGKKDELAKRLMEAIKDDSEQQPEDTELVVSSSMETDSQESSQEESESASEAPVVENKTKETKEENTTGKKTITKNKY